MPAEPQNAFGHTTVVAYPAIEPPLPFLLGAALLWDKVVTVTPEGFAPERVHRERRPHEELAAAGFLEPYFVGPKSRAVMAVADDAIDYLTSPAALRLVGDAETSWLWSSKLAPSLLTALEQVGSGLPRSASRIREGLRTAVSKKGQRWDPGHGETRELSIVFKQYYMSLLARHIARDHGYGVTTYNDAAEAFVRSLEVHQESGLTISGSDDDIRRHYGHVHQDAAAGLFVEVLFDGMVQPEEPSIQDVLKFAEKRRDERNRFRIELGKLSEGLEELPTLDAIRQTIGDRIDGSVVPSLRDLQRSIRSERWSSSLGGLLKASFFVAAPTSAAILAGVPGTVALVAGTGISVIATVVEIRGKEVEKMRGNSFSYLLKQRNRFGL